MDAKEELSRDKWIQDHLYECITCKFRKLNYCNNKDSENYGKEIEAACDKWVEKDWAEIIHKQREQVFRDCNKCSYNKPIIRDRKVIGSACSQWKCIYEDKSDTADFDCALKE